MLKATNDERGTVAALGALSRELDDRYQDGMSAISLESRVITFNLQQINRSCFPLATSRRL